MSAATGTISGPGPAHPGTSGGELGFPLLGRLLVALTLVASALAAAAMLSFWDDYRLGPAVAAAWFATAATAPVAVGRIVAAGVMTRGPLAGVATVVLGSDIVVPFMLEPALRTTPAAWNWRSGAALIVLLSAYRAPRDVVLLAGTHAAVAVAWGLQAGAGVTALVVLIVVCSAPPLIAANYLALYTEGLRTRQTAVDLFTRTRALRAAEQAERRSVLDEVASIRHRIVVLLDSVGRGERVASDPEVRREAKDLSAALRRELDETRSRGWLLTGDRVGESWGGPVIDVLGPAALLDDDARASVAALVELLRRHDDLQQIVVTVSAVPFGEAGRTGCELTVVASGPASAAAAADPAIVAAAEGLRAVVWHDGEADHLVVETHLRLG